MHSFSHTQLPEPSPASTREEGTEGVDKCVWWKEGLNMETRMEFYEEQESWEPERECL